ncbi:hypothetical protein [Botrimarina hoheduenensis]|uniref:Uncharacterized protein n=1 Tax=Botrimarina hoheduenensis TaxID=2528000 RepID=A0A5C5VZC6_9BACT|nr:hypothetical protein [Botrimarina hoheduenensis]TWT43447.1 hypothetical protein Pla111_23980 [Botrimarina hoheduenensis]
MFLLPASDEAPHRRLAWLAERLDTLRRGDPHEDPPRLAKEVDFEVHGQFLFALFALLCCVITVIATFWG